MELWCVAVPHQLDMFISTAQTLPWTCPLSYAIQAQCICPEVKVPPTPTPMVRGSSKSSDSSQLSGSNIQPSGIGQAIVHSLPSARQPTGIGLSAARASMSQTQLTPALSQGYSYNLPKNQPISGGSLPVPMEAMSFGMPSSQPYNLYASLPQTSTYSTQEVAPSSIPVSRPVHPTIPVPALHSQETGSTMAPIFQKCG